jgi:hypothetical protein
MSGRVPSRGSDQFNLRFPEGMRDELKKLAAENGRSLNAEIIQRLEQTMTTDLINDGLSNEIIGNFEFKEERDKAILRAKLEEAFVGSGLTQLMAEFMLKDKLKKNND